LHIWSFEKDTVQFVFPSIDRRKLLHSRLFYGAMQIMQLCVTQIQCPNQLTF